MLEGWQGWPVSARTVLFFGMVGGVVLFVFFSRITSVSFCGTEFQIPDECDAPSKHQLACDDCFMSWSYVEGDMLKILSEQVVQEITQHNYPSTREIIDCNLLGTKVNAYKIISNKRDHRENTIIAFGTVNNHSVLVKLTAPHDLSKNEDIPAVARQIISVD